MGGHDTRHRLRQRQDTRSSRLADPLKELCCGGHGLGRLPQARTRDSPGFHRRGPRMVRGRSARSPALEHLPAGTGSRCPGSADHTPGYREGCADHRPRLEHTQHLTFLGPIGGVPPVPLTTTAFLSTRNKRKTSVNLAFWNDPLQRLTVMLHHPSSMALGMLAKKTCAQDTEHCQARVRLSKATWGNVIATRYRSARGHHFVCRGLRASTRALRHYAI